MFISPTEPGKFHELGPTSSKPEEYGVDFMWESALGRVGVQRKQFPDDFLASVHDGRLNREYMMMTELDLGILMLEGKAFWTNTGELIRPRNGKRHAWTKTQHRNYLTSVQLRGITVNWTDDIVDSIQYLRDLQMWSEKAEHVGLDTRPGPKGSSGWGVITSQDYYAHLLQSLPGIGPKQARAIIAHLGSIIGLTVSVDELMTVPGIGKGRAEKIVRVFNGRHSHAKKV